MTLVIDHDAMMQQLADYVQAQPDFKKADRVYVSVYLHSQHYGGPEEGGWWYDRYQLMGSKPFVSREEADTWLEAAKVEIERRNHDEAPARHRAMASLPDEDREPCPANCLEGYIPQGWSDGGKWMIVVEDRMGCHDNMNEPRPHYE